MENNKIYSDFVNKADIAGDVSFEELEEMIEQEAREEEADDVVLAEDKRI